MECIEVRVMRTGSCGVWTWPFEAWISASDWEIRVLLLVSDVDVQLFFVHFVVPRSCAAAPLRPPCSRCEKSTAACTPRKLKHKPHNPDPCRSQEARSSQPLTWTRELNCTYDLHTYVGMHSKDYLSLSVCLSTYLFTQIWTHKSKFECKFKYKYKYECT